MRRNSVPIYKIHGNGQLFLRNWCDMGIRVIHDLISEEGVFYSFEQLKAKYNIRGTFLDTFLDYQHVLNSISQVWKDQINMNCVFIVQTAYIYIYIYKRLHEKTCLRCVQPCKTETGLLSHRLANSHSARLVIVLKVLIGIILSRQRTTTLLIRLRRCLCCSHMS